MANVIIVSVHNNTDHNIPLRVPGYSSVREDVIVPASSDLALNGPLTEDECIAIQPLLNSLISAGALSSNSTQNTDFLDWND